MRKTIVIFIIVAIAAMTISLVVLANGPTIATNPVNGATGVAVTTNVTATVSSGCTIGANCLTLEGPGGQMVNGNLSGCGTPAATFDPDNDLAPNTTYTAEITYNTPTAPASPEIMPGNTYKWTFTTASPVGGLTYSNDTIRLLTPWIALAALSGLALATGAVTLRKRTG